MDEKRLGEAVEVALAALRAEEMNTFGDYLTPDNGARRKTMRAALLAALPVLLGEPVAWMRTDVTYRGIDGRREGERILSERRVYANDTPVYAPSLGEGDGR